MGAASKASGARRQARALRPPSVVSCRTGNLLLAVLAAVLVGSSDAQVRKQNTTWIFPTPGCRAERAGEDCYPFCPMRDREPCDRNEVCKPVYIKTPMGKSVQWTMAAANPTPPDAVFLTRSAGSGPRDLGRSCCGFHPVLAEQIWSVTATDQRNPEGVIAPVVAKFPPMLAADVLDDTAVASTRGALISRNLDKRNLNITWVQFSWNVTRQQDVGIPVTPLYNITFDAQYAYSLNNGLQRLRNNSACQKTIFFRICSEPFFTASPTYSTLPLLGAPNPANLKDTTAPQNIRCGLAKHTPCLGTPGKLEPKGADTLTVFEMGMFDAQGLNHGVRVGEKVELNFSLSSLDLGGRVRLQTPDDPGLPIGATLSEDVPCGMQSVCRTLTWTPRKGQEGKAHDAHVMGTSFSSTLQGGSVPPQEEPCDQLYTKETIFRMKVMTPVSSWLAPRADIPYSHYLQRFPGTAGPGGAQLLQLQPNWAGNAVVGTAFNVTLQCKSNYMPKLDMDGSAAHFNMVGGVQDLGDGNRIMTYQFSYTPKRGDEGSTKTWHFHCGDDQYVEARNILTIVVRTKLCAYSVDSGETLSTMTRRYHLSTNWLNVWNANPMLLSDPDLDLEAGSQVRIGPVYSVKSGDTLQTIAAQFATTIKKLLSVNPHLTPEPAPQMELMGETRLCIIACTSHPAPSNSYKWAY